MASNLPNTVVDNGALFQRYCLYAVALLFTFFSFSMLSGDAGFFASLVGYFCAAWAFASFIAGFTVETTYHKEVELQTAKYNKRRN